MRALSRVFPLCGILLALAGCAANTMHGLSTGELPPVPAERQWPSAADDALNERANGMGLVNMPEMQAYLNGILAKIKEAAGVPNWPGSVYIMASSSLDAHSTAAGNVYISLGWIASAESEDEIAAILAHEYGHVYLDFQQVQAASQGTDSFAGLLAQGLSLAHSVGATKNPYASSDNLMYTYKFGKGLIMPAWSRQQEENADRFGATVSLRLNYSYTRGFKSFLERMATWETQTAEKEADEQKRMASTDQGLADWWKGVTVNHPKTEDRLASLTDQVEPLLKGKPRPPARVEPWTKAQTQPRTATILKNYQAASDAQAALQQKNLSNALKLANQAASGPTAQQALPVMALSLAQAAQSGANAKTQAAKTLDRNLTSDIDRSWRIVALRTTDLMESGQKNQAHSVLDKGFDYFHQAPLAWPEAIAFYDKLDGSVKAKQLAQQCATNYPPYANQCNQAAMTPAEQAAAQKEEQPGILNTLIPGFKF
jgi:predicted Zn-dependent protease